jgi:hypothetical protein
MFFIETKALGGVNFIRADFVTAVSSNDSSKCNVFVQGAGNSIPCVEPARDVVEKLERALAEAHAAATANAAQEG